MACSAFAEELSEGCVMRAHCHGKRIEYGLKFRRVESGQDLRSDEHHGIVFNGIRTMKKITGVQLQKTPVKGCWVRCTEFDNLQSEPGDAFIQKEDDTTQRTGVLTDDPHGWRDALKREFELKQPGFDIIDGAHVDSGVVETRLACSQERVPSSERLPLSSPWDSRAVEMFRVLHAELRPKAKWRPVKGESSPRW